MNGSNTPQTTGQVETTYSSWHRIDVEVIADGGWSEGSKLNAQLQQVLVQKLKVNAARLFPLP